MVYETPNLYVSYKLQVPQKELLQVRKTCPDMYSKYFEVSIRTTFHFQDCQLLQKLPGGFLESWCPEQPWTQRGKSNLGWVV